MELLDDLDEVDRVPVGWLDRRRRGSRSGTRGRDRRPTGTEHGFEVLAEETGELLCIESPNPEAARAAKGGGA